MLDLSLFRSRRFTAGAGGIALTFFAMFGMIFGLTQYLQFVLGKSALEAGALMLSTTRSGCAGAVTVIGTDQLLSASLVSAAAAVGARQALRDALSPASHTSDLPQ